MNPIAHATASSPNTAQSQPSSSGPVDPLANESTFLTLLVSQLKNQDPENPPDTNQFLAQLTSYSQLEQLIKIDSNTAPPANDATTTSKTNADNTKPTTGV